ncbi:MAG: redox-sensing transcriptional repressor Rex [Phycisphaerae bacterium]
MRNEEIPNPAVYRLSFYLRQLESFRRGDRHTISSRQLGEALGYSDAQVRKDLAYFGQFGHPGIGYRVEDLVHQLKKILGTDKISSVLLVGAGNLGRALLAYKGFLQKGFRIVAIFDADAAKVGKKIGDLPVRSDQDIASVAAELQIRMAMLAVPVAAAQSVANQLVTVGIKGILNFAPVALNVPGDVVVQSVDLALQLEQLSFRMTLGDASPSDESSL